jgi:hypothetical protein
MTSQMGSLTSKRRRHDYKARQRGKREEKGKVWKGCSQVLSKFVTNDQLPRVSPQLPLSANEKGDNEMKPGTVYRSPGI